MENNSTAAASNKNEWTQSRADRIHGRHKGATKSVPMGTLTAE